MLSCPTPCRSLTREDSSRRWPAVDERPHGPRLRGLHAFEEPPLLRRERPSRLRHARLGAGESSRCLRREGEQRSLGGDKTRRWQAAIADGFDCPIPPIVSTVLGGSPHVVAHRSQGLPIHPQPPRRLGQPRCHLEGIPRQGDPAITMGGAGTEGPGAPAGALVGCREAASGLAQHGQWHGRRARLLAPARRRGGMVQREKGLGGPLDCQGRPRQGQRSVRPPSRDIAMRLPQRQRAFAWGAAHRLVVNLPAGTDGFKVRGERGPAALCDPGRRRPLAPPGARQHRQRAPTRLGGGHGTGQPGASRAIEPDEAPPLHSVAGKGHHTAVHAPRRLGP